jgi:flagellin-specific chaperone FliS
MTFPRSALVAALAALALVFCDRGMAQDKHDHAHDKEKHFNVTPPADIKAAWTLITAKTKEARQLLAEKKIEPLHEMTEHLEAAVHVLEEKSTMVTGEKKRRLASALKQLDKSVDELHHAAEENDTGGIGTALTKIASLLPLVEAQYPAGALE